MISVSETIYIHDILIERFGGSSGIRDVGLLESALARPFQTFDGADLYPESIEKAADLIQSLLNNHPFVDGNKRTAYVLMRLILINDGYDIVASQEEKYQIVISASKGKARFDDIKIWIEAQLQRKDE